MPQRATRGTSATRSLFAGKRRRVFGHRGAAGAAPENTLVSFRRALLDGADVLEMDVHLTRDGYIVVCHDPKVDRTTNGVGAIKNLNLDEIRRLDAGYRFQAADGTFPYRGQGIQIPLLEEVLQEFPDIAFNIELKAKDPALISKFSALLRKFGRLDDQSVMVAASNHRLVRRIRRACSTCPTTFSRREIAISILLARLQWSAKPNSQMVRSFQVPLRRGRVRIVTPAFVRYAHALGCEVHVWTINDEAEMRRLLEMGVDGIFTDFPGRLRKIVDAFQCEGFSSQ